MQKGDVLYRFDQDPWRDLREEIAAAQEEAGGVLTVTGNLAAHVMVGSLRWRITVDEPVTDFAQAAVPFHGLEVANGCGLVIVGPGGTRGFFTTRPLLVMAGIPAWPATDVGQEIIRLRRAGEITDIPPGHPGGGLSGASLRAEGRPRDPAARRSRPENRGSGDGRHQRSPVDAAGHGGALPRRGRR